jgi:tetratricopeptide (TPR) repeat protein/4-amino-4-deoxy-L-arabinose transferase-like glycosyltransferase
VPRPRVRTRPSARQSRAAAPPRSVRRSTRTRLAWFLAGVLGIKLVIVWQLKDHVLLQPSTTMDTGSYVELAQKVIAGDWGLGPGLYYVSPLYIYFLALIDGLTGSLTAVRVAQVLLGTMSVGFIFTAAREWFGERAAWIAAVLAGFTGLFSFYESVLLQASLDAVLTSAVLLSLTLALKRGVPRWYMLTGLLFGIQSLNRPNVLVAAAAIGVLLLLLGRVKPSLWVAVGLIVGLAPVAVRNVVVSGDWSLLSSQGGLNFYIGNNAQATGWYRPVPGVAPTIEGQAHDTRVVAEGALHRTLTDGEVSSYFTGLAWAWIRHHPATWMRLFARKLNYVFNAQHTALPLSYPFYAYDARTLLRFLFVGPWLLAPLGLVGLTMGVRTVPADRRIEYLVWLAFVPAYLLAVAVFFVAERYRLPLLVPYAIGAGAALDAVGGYFGARPVPTRPLLAVGAGLAVLFTFVNWPLHIVDGDGRSEERVHMAENLARFGRVEEAEEWLALALPTNSNPGAAEYRVGVQFVNASRLTPAIAHLRASLEIAPGEPHAEFALGQALAAAGRVQESIPHLQRAADVGADIDLAGYDLAVAFMETGDFTDAARALRAVTPSANTGVQVWMDLGRLAMKVQAPDVAERFFRHAAEMAPNSPDARQAYGLALLAVRKYDDARRELAAAMATDPKNADSPANLAYAELELGRVADARTHVAVALRLNPAQALALQLQASLSRIR